MATKLDKYLSAALRSSLPAYKRPSMRQMTISEWLSTPQIGSLVSYYSLTGRIVSVKDKHYKIQLTKVHTSKPLHTKFAVIRKDSMAIKLLS